MFIRFRALGVFFGYVSLLTAFALPFPVFAAEAESFIVEDIRIEGLRRISEGTVLSYLPIIVGDTVDAEKVQDAIRVLYRAGFFSDVKLYRDNGMLVVEVKERPSIASFVIEGNREIKTEDLSANLRQMGLVEGRIFNRSTLEAIKQELINVYYSRGRYNARVESEVTDVGDDQVNVNIKIYEGPAASVREVNIVGNSAFSDDTLLENMELQTTNFWSWLSQDDRYVREKLRGDLEKLRSYYLDRGYADFAIESVQVSIAPDRKYVYIAINLDEGEVYTVKETRLIGEFVVPEQELRSFILVQPGSTFSMAVATATADMISYRLGSSGYAQAEVTPAPELDKENKEVTLTFFFDPGRRIYINKINFLGSSATDDEVFRREMRVFEGGWLSNSDMERSNIRLQRLPFVEDVEMDTVPVAGTEDMVDVNFDINERSPGNFQFGVGYGGTSQGLFIDTSVTHSNFLGRGERVSVSLRRNDFSQLYDVSHTDPYLNEDGIAQTLSAFYSNSTSLTREFAVFDTSSYGASAFYNFPLSEFSSVGSGLSVAHNELVARVGQTQEHVFDFVSDPRNGDPFETLFGPGLEYNTYELSASWSRDTRNRVIFANRGSRIQVVAERALPIGNDVLYYGGRTSYLQYIGLGAGFTLSLNGEVAFTEPVGDFRDVPPGKRLFAGGPRSVRGYRDGRLGPIDFNALPVGGRLRTFLQTDLILPNFMADEGSRGDQISRFSLFFDAGNVFAKSDDFSASELRLSAGVSAIFLTPLGAMRFSYGVPINKRPEDIELHRRLNNNFFEEFQFTIGTVF